MPPPTDTDGRLATIRALLAKAEATTFAAEAEAFTAKASELMARYAVDEAMLWAGARDTSGTPTEIRLVLHRPFTAQKAVLVNAVANAYGCQALRLGRADDGATEHMSVIGFASDLSLVETLVTSLFLQLTSAMTAPLPGPAGRPASQVAAWRRSFIMGFTATITERLRADRARATAETDRERHPVADRAQPPRLLLALRTQAPCARSSALPLDRPPPSPACGSRAPAHLQQRTPTAAAKRVPTDRWHRHRPRTGSTQPGCGSTRSGRAAPNTRPAAAAPDPWPQASTASTRPA